MIQDITVISSPTCSCVESIGFARASHFPTHTNDQIIGFPYVVMISCFTTTTCHLFVPALLRDRQFWCRRAFSVELEEVKVGSLSLMSVER